MNCTAKRKKKKNLLERNSTKTCVSMLEVDKSIMKGALDRMTRSRKRFRFSKLVALLEQDLSLTPGSLKNMKDELKHIKDLYCC
jgi:hypothetical protein